LLSAIILFNVATLRCFKKQQIHQGLILNGPLVLVKKTLIYFII